MRLNVCCGVRIREGWTNIDVVESEGHKPDILADAKSIPLPDECADEIMCIHGFEHFYKWEVDELVTEWKRLLKPGGLLALELPDIVKCCQNLIAGYVLPGKDPDQMTMWGIYGDPRFKSPFMMHRWGWSPKTLRAFLKGHGFRDITDEQTQWHPAGRVARDMRITARK